MTVRTPQRRLYELGRHPGLDGLRGLAVVAVVLYHGGVPWLGGGFIGVELFFVLSGFLITSLLVGEWQRTRTIALRAFWGRRARRLLPALLLVVAAIGIYYAVAGPTHAIPGLKGDGLATLLYFANWHQIAAGSSYFATTGPVSPLQHTWSLAIEEQFYLVWPLLVLGILRLAAGGAPDAAARIRALRALLILSLLGALASATEMALLFDGGKGVNRVYYGTDTRAFGLLFGASLATTLALRRSRPATAAAALSALRRHALVVGSTLALVLVLGATVLARGSASWMYPYGFIVIDLGTIAMIATIVLQPQALVARLLSWPPLRRLGTISYGLYLWHFPLFQWLDQDSTGLTGLPLLVLRVAAALGASVLSYMIVEQPIRRRRLPRWTVRSLTPVAVGGTVACLLLGSAMSSISFSDADATSLPKPAASLAGDDAPCARQLTDTASVGSAPLPLATAQKTEYTALGDHSLTWKGSSTVTFRTCPPAKVLVVGDSLAYTIGVGLMENEQRYGVEVDNAAILGCAFDANATGQMQISGVWQSQSAGCADALSTWAADARSLDAQAVVVELGYRDQFDWKIDGTVQHLGQAAFDAQLQQTIDRYVQVLGAGGRKVIFLSVPWSKPPANPDGSASVAGTPARHRTINAMLTRAARSHANVSIVNIDTTVSPHGAYQPDVNGKLCRFDGVHFTLYCSQLLQPAVLGAVRRQLAG